LKIGRNFRSTAANGQQAANDGQVLQVAEPAAYETRYQVGYAQHLRDALPNATFVAFTGTPVSSEDRDTRAVFGDYIHVYDMQQAKEDGATVAIYFRVAPRQAVAETGRRCRRSTTRSMNWPRMRKKPAGATEKQMGGTGKGGRCRAAHRQRGRRSGRSLRGTQQGAERQGDGRRHEPGDLRPSLQRDRQTAPGMARHRS
jgi:hypothetical protein